MSEWFTAAAHLFQKGGFAMYPILVCSITTVMVGIERQLFFRGQNSERMFLQSLDKALAKGDWEQAARQCEASDSAAAYVLARGLRHLEYSRTGLENVLEGAAAFASSKLRTRLDYLDTIVTLAPLLGLLGTVLGMIESFSVLNLREGQPLALTGGVGEALVATAAGLCVAIVAMIIYSYFRHRVDAIVTEMEQACTILIGYADRRG